MANQFNAKIRFDAYAWSAYDKELNAHARVVENNHGGADWYVNVNGEQLKGYCNSAQVARAKCRREIEKRRPKG